MKLCSIFSGSSGNCIYVGSEHANILVDAGSSGKKIETGLASIQVDPKKIDGIFITHEHSDHIKGVGIMARRHQIPIYGTVETIHAMLHTKNVGKIPEELIHTIEPDQTISLKDMEINPFSISHDAANPVSYTFSSGGHKVGIATDLGTYDDYIIEHLKESEILLLEANHDIHMLQVGPYPYILKKRILGDKGHLSNDNSGKLICSLLHSKMKHIFLGHLSHENNYPDLAFETVKYELSQCDSPYKNNCTLNVAKRDEPSMMVSV